MFCISTKTILAVAAFSGMTAVILGAFGAHALRDSVEPSLINAYQTGVQYHFYHTFALFAVGLLAVKSMLTTWLKLSSVFFAVGIILFSGSLYLIAVTGVRQLGIITPFGGVSFIVAWFFLGLELMKQVK